MKKNRATPEVNAGSMADIAFLLLIFFLVTTTIDTDKGISIRLPPMPEPNQPENNIKLKERNVLKILVNSADQLLVDGKLVTIKELKKTTKNFIDNPAQDPDLAETPQKAVISLKNDRGTSYNIYIQVHNELKAAYNELREAKAQAEYGRPLDKLTQEQADEIRDYYRQVISEAEPEDAGGGN
ncbi:MAG: biopolymer transporter ExbD [Sphingobacteriaceae bacterium]|nr:biopolymer transporter ExbD [Sphingobacteriaceae bacterium]